MTLPLIHLNGTSAKDLSDGYEAAYYALQAAQDALASTAPNGRDYYDREGAFVAARDEHFARRAKVQAALDEISALLVHVHDNRPR